MVEILFPSYSLLLSSFIFPMNSSVILNRNALYFTADFIHVLSICKLFNMKYPCFWTDRNSFKRAINTCIHILCRPLRIKLWNEYKKTVFFKRNKMRELLINLDYQERALWYVNNSSWLSFEWSRVRSLLGVCILRQGFCYYIFCPYRPRRTNFRACREVSIILIFLHRVSCFKDIYPRQLCISIEGHDNPYRNVVIKLRDR